MAHQHLCFHCLDGFECHTNNDDDRRAADAEGRVADDDADENRHDCHDCKIQSAKERNLVDNLQNEISRGLARAEAGDEAAVLLEVVGDLDGVELNGGIEVAERDDQACPFPYNDIYRIRS